MSTSLPQGGKGLGMFKTPATGIPPNKILAPSDAYIPPAKVERDRGYQAQRACSPAIFSLFVALACILIPSLFALCTPQENVAYLIIES